MGRGEQVAQAQLRDYRRLLEMGELVSRYHPARGLRERLNRRAKRSQQAADLPQMLVLQEHSVQVSAPKAPSQQYVCSHRHTLT